MLLPPIHVQCQDTHGMFAPEEFISAAVQGRGLYIKLRTVDGPIAPMTYDTHELALAAFEQLKKDLADAARYGVHQ